MRKCCKIYLILFILSLDLQGFCTSSDLNESISTLSDRVSQAISSIYTENANIGVIPFVSKNPELWHLCQVTFDLFKYHLKLKGFNSLVSDERMIRTLSFLKLNVKDGLLSENDITRIKELLATKVLITGNIVDLYTLFNVNVYIWDCDRVGLMAVQSVQVRKTVNVLSLIELSSQKSEGQLERYSLKWQSGDLSFKILAMSTADIDGDNVNELIILTEEEIKVLQWNGFSFVERKKVRYIDTKKLKRNQRDIRFMLILDGDSDGKPEVYVSVPNMNTGLWVWKDNDIVNTEMLSEVVITHRDGNLIVSSLRQDRNYFSNQATSIISRVDHSKTELKLPFDYYSLNIGETNGMEGKEYILISKDNRLVICSEEMVPLWQSGKMEFGFGISISDLDNDGKNEIIGTSALLGTTKDHVKVLKFNGSTYIEDWRSKDLNGNVSALCVGDPNNDGITELILSVWKDGQSRISLYTTNF